MEARQGVGRALEQHMLEAFFLVRTVGAEGRVHELPAELALVDIGESEADSRPQLGDVALLETQIVGQTGVNSGEGQRLGGVQALPLGELGKEELPLDGVGVVDECDIGLFVDAFESDDGELGEVVGEIS